MPVSSRLCVFKRGAMVLAKGGKGEKGGWGGGGGGVLVLRGTEAYCKMYCLS